MTDASDNLSGFWVGSYRYDGAAKDAVQFLVTMEESDGHALSGTISEPNSMGRTSKELHAILSGNRDGLDIFFAKTYDGASDAAHRVDYYGVLSEDGRRISGHWSLAGTSGTFEMTREILSEEEVEVEIREEVSVEKAMPT